MKIKNLSEILDSKEKEMELTFTHFVNSIDGTLYEAGYQPENYKNVIRLTGNLYLAFDEDPDDGTVYLGEWV